MVPGKNIEFIFSTFHDRDSCTEEQVHLFSAFRELMLEVHAGKGHIFGLVEATDTDRIMHGWLCSEAERIDAVMPENFFVLRDERSVCGEDVGRKLCGLRS